MFSIVFPGQGSQKIGMVKEFYEKYDLAKRLFKDADAILNVPITKIIFEGPEKKLNLTENTQPAIFLASYCIFEIIKKEFGYNFKFFIFLLYKSSDNKLMSFLRPLTATCSGELSFAIKHSYFLLFSSKILSNSFEDIPKTANIAPSPLGTASCMNLPLF